MTLHVVAVPGRMSGALGERDVRIGLMCASCSTVQDVGKMPTPEYLSRVAAEHQCGDGPGRARTCHCDGPPHAYDPSWCKR